MEWWGGGVGDLWPATKTGPTHLLCCGAHYPPPEPMLCKQAHVFFDGGTLGLCSEQHRLTVSCCGELAMTS
jgi:hypothetical protein